MRYSIIENLKYITIFYTNALESVKLMVQEHYDIPEYQDTVFLINSFDLLYDDTYDCRQLKTYKRKIYYMLEHRVKQEKYTQEQYIEDTDIVCRLRDLIGITEFWTMDYEPQLVHIVRQQTDIPIKYKPMRYTSLIKEVKETYNTVKYVDFCHVGTIGDSEHRINLIKGIESFYCYMSTKFVTATKNLRLSIPELNTSRYIIDTLREDGMLTPNQVRIFELICMGYTVCTEKCSLNMFPGLVYEWSTMDDLWHILENDEYLHPAKAYKEMTYTDEAYEKYINQLIELQNGI